MATTFPNPNMAPTFVRLFSIATMLSAVTAQTFSYAFGPQIQLAVDALADVLDRGAPISGQLELVLR